MNMQVLFLTFGMACAALGTFTTYVTTMHHKPMSNKAINLITTCESSLPRVQKCVLIAVEDEKQ